MQISVALATYNGARFLAEQLASLAGQTRRPDELVVSDDGSTDETIERVRHFAESAPFPVIIADNAERVGFADNFLRAASCCRHDLIAFCDQDDVWLPRKLELGAERIQADGSHLSMHTLTVTNEWLRPTGFEWDQGIYGDIVQEPLSLDPFATGWGNTMVFRRELLRAVPAENRPRQPFDQGRPLSHDTWMYVLAAALGRVSWISKPLILYRQHGSTTTVAAKPPTRRKLSSFLDVPVLEFREHAYFSRQMADLMRELARQGGAFAEAADAAAERYRERVRWWSARTAIFDGASLDVRRHAYGEFHELNRAKPHWFGSKLKDFLLGVSGFTRACETTAADRVRSRA